MNELCVCEICNMEAEEVNVVCNMELCEECFREHTCECEECGETILLDDSYSVWNGKEYIHVCESCYYNVTIECEHCGERILESIAIERYNTNDSKVYLCENCDENYTFYCEYHERNEYFGCGEVYEVVGYGEICDDAYTWGDFYMCEQCEMIYHRNDLCYNEYDEQLYCEECYNECCGGIISDYHEHTEDYEYEKRYARNEDEDDNSILTFGVEVEVDGSKTNIQVKDFAENINDNTSLFVFEYDGSLNHNSVEVISYPFSMEYIKSSNDFEYLHKKINSMEFNCEDETCGYHIHVGRNEQLNQEHLATVLEYFKDEFKALSKRNEVYLNKWAKFMTCGTKEDFINEQFDIMKEKIDDGVSRYHAINLGNYATIEFRMFSGSNSFKENMARIEMINNLCKWTINNKAIMNDIYMRNDLEQLQQLNLFEILTYDSNEYVEEYLLNNFSNLFNVTLA